MDPCSKLFELSFVAASVVVLACGNAALNPASDGGSDATAADAAGDAGGVARFFGSWDYQSGTTLTVQCPNAAAVQHDISHTSDGRQSYFTMSLDPDGKSLHELDIRGCNFDFDVSGDTATAWPDQPCDKQQAADGGTTWMSASSVHKTTSDGQTMAVSAELAIGPLDAGCPATLQGTAIKRSVDSSVVGTWQEPPSATAFVWRFGADGTVVAAKDISGLANAVASAWWSTAANVLLFHAMSGPCVSQGVDGTYAYTTSATTLSFTKVVDACSGRALIDGETLSRVTQ